jgi:glycosidase
LKDNFEILQEIAFGRVDDRLFRGRRIKYAELKTLWSLSRWEKVKWMLGLLRGGELERFERYGGILNMRACYLIREFWARDAMSLSQLVKRYGTLLNNLNHTLHYAFLDNHDLDRYFSLCKGAQDEKLNRMKLALAFLFIQPFKPTVYQGTELPMGQQIEPEEKIPFKDVHFRRFFDWKSLNRARFTKWIKFLSSTREKYGSCSTFKESKGCLVMENEKLQVILNPTLQTKDFLTTYRRVIKIEGKVVGMRLSIEPYGLSIAEI